MTSTVTTQLAVYESDWGEKREDVSPPVPLRTSILISAHISLVTTLVPSGYLQQ